MDSKIDFSSYSLNDLYQSGESIEREKYPERAKEIDSLIRQKKTNSLILQKKIDSPKEVARTKNVGEKATQYKCSQMRIILINLIGVSIASIFSLFSESNSTSSTTGDFLIFLVMSLFFLLCLIGTLYTGKFITRTGVQCIQDNYSSVTIGQVILSHLFYLTLIMGFKSFA